MYLFLDVESTGLPRNFKAPVSDSGNWPHLVSISWQMHSPDFKPLHAYHYIIKPKGFEIPAASMENASTDGINPVSSLPATLEEAIVYLLPRFEGMEAIAEQYDEDAFASFCHSQLSGGIGMNRGAGPIRNELKLWIHESPLHQYMLAHHNLFHPDEMSALIIRGIYNRIKKPAPL